MYLFSTAPEHLCIIRMSALGDCCNALACALAIKKSWPQTKMTWIACPTEAKLISLYPEFDVEIFQHASLKSYLALWKKLWRYKFDAVVNLQTSIKASLLTLGLRYRFHLGYDQTRARELQALFTNVKVPSPLSPHVVDGFMAFAHTLGLPHATPIWQGPPLQDLSYPITELLTGQPLVILTLGASKTEKNWLPTHYAKIANYTSQLGFQVLLCGSASPIEIQLGKQVQSQGGTQIINLIGRTTLTELIGLIQRASALIGPDSGPIHLANLCGTPAIGLHAIHPATRTGAYRYLDYAVCVYEQLVHLSKLKKPQKWRAPIKIPYAMAHISPVQVQCAFDRLYPNLPFQLNGNPHVSTNTSCCTHRQK